MNRMPSLRLTLALTVSLASVTGAIPVRDAWADDAGQARFHDRRARSLYQRGRFEDALREFFVVRRLAPDIQTLFNIALCFEQLGEPHQAFFYFSSFAEDPSAPEGRRQYAKTALERLRPQVAQIVVESEPPGAEVFLDRLEHGSWGQTPLTLPVIQGTHEIWVEKEQFRRTSTKVRARRGQKAQVRLELAAILGTLTIRTQPPAEVVISNADGASFGSGASPFTLRLPPGVYVAEGKAKGFRPERVVVRVTEDAQVQRNVVLEALPPAKGTVTVTSNIPGSLIQVDGEPTGFSPAFLSDLDLGVRQVEVSSQGLEPWLGSIEVQEGGRGYLTATLRPEPTTERSVWTWISGGVGVSALAAAAITGAVALDTQNQFNDTPTAALASQGETFAAVADGLYVAAGVSLAAAVVLYFVSARETEPSGASFTWEAEE